MSTLQPFDDSARRYSHRELLERGGMGLGMLGLAAVLASDGSVARADDARPLAPKRPHFGPKAKRLVHLFMNGGPSHVDTFDPKPALDKYHGKPLPVANLRTERKNRRGHALPLQVPALRPKWHRSERAFSKTAECIDDICVIRSMQADVPNHEPSLMLMNCGDARLPRPSLGSWLTYGLGTENQNLPGFIAMCPGGYPMLSATRSTHFVRF